MQLNRIAMYEAEQYNSQRGWRPRKGSELGWRLNYRTGRYEAYSKFPKYSTEWRR